MISDPKDGKGTDKRGRGVSLSTCCASGTLVGTYTYYVVEIIFGVLMVLK